MWTTWLTKFGSTALTRRIAQGVLSPYTIGRAAGAMAPGKFRFIQNLGRGQFNLADRVVGHVVDQTTGKAAVGQMSRKIPTQVLRPGQTLQTEYGPTKELVSHLNQRYGVPGKAPPIAPYVAVNQQGAFQELATGHVPKLPAGLKQHLGDVHPGNIGPGGQVLDFALDAQHGIPSGAIPLPNANLFGRKRIDPVSSTLDRQHDVFANLGAQRPEFQSSVQPFMQRSNALVRRYWNLAPEARPQYAAQLQATEADRGSDLTKRLIAPFHKPVPPDPWSPARWPTAWQRKPIGAWTDFKSDPKPYLFTGGVGASVLGGAGYGLHALLRSLYGDNR